MVSFEDINVKAVEEMARNHVKMKDLNKVSELAASLCLMRANLKPAVLVDFCKIQISAFLSLLEKVLDDGMVLKISEDYFFLDRTLFISHLEAVLARPPVYLDITSSTARFLESSKIGEMQSFLTTVIDKVQKSESNFLEIDLDPDMNLCSVFGIFLGYPVVYWFHTSQEPSSLNNQDLLLVSLKYRNYTLISYSVPSHMYTEHAEVRKAVHTWMASKGVELAGDDVVAGSQDVELAGLCLKLNLTTVNLPFVAL